MRPENKREELLPPVPYATATSTGGRKWVYPRRFEGSLWKLRRVVAVLLLLVYTALPHVRINGLPAMLLDIPARRFAFFGTQFWPTDTLLLGLLLMSIILGIVALTALFGRVWCGWGCPQTVYMEFVFRPIENWLEGQWLNQRKFDDAPWDRRKILRRGLKWLIFLFIAMIMAHTFLAYFVGTDKLAVWMTRSPIEHPLSFLIMAAVTGAILFDFGWFREQMCTIACPYGRLQGAMMDEHTLRVAYDEKRGEPRGKLQRAPLELNAQVHGDCIDCNQCVQACPTGIDIRNGLQLECISCTQCVDACNGVMAKIDKPPGLIRTTSAAVLEGRSTRLMRPRMGIYAAVLAVLLGTLSYKLETRAESTVTVVRAVEQPYTVLTDGRISNHLRVRISNRGLQPRQYTVDLKAPASAQLLMPASPLSVNPGEIGTGEIFVMLEVAALRNGHQTLELQVIDDKGHVEPVTFRFVGPLR